MLRHYYVLWKCMSKSQRYNWKQATKKETRISIVTQRKQRWSLSRWYCSYAVLVKCIDWFFFLSVSVFERAVCQQSEAEHLFSDSYFEQLTLQMRKVATKRIIDFVSFHSIGPISLPNRHRPPLLKRKSMILKNKLHVYTQCVAHTYRHYILIVHFHFIRQFSNLQLNVWCFYSLCFIACVADLSFLLSINGISSLSACLFYAIMHWFISNIKSCHEHWHRHQKGHFFLFSFYFIDFFCVHFAKWRKTIGFHFKLLIFFGIIEKCLS